MSENIRTTLTGASGTWILHNGKFPRMQIEATIEFATLREIQTFDPDAICKGLEDIFARAVTFAPRDTPSAGRRDETNQKEKNKQENDR